MTTIDLEALDRALDLLPAQFRGPGGVAGVVHAGRVVARRAWGHADPGRRQTMTAATRLPICSISKQMTCALLLDLFDDPEALAPFLPELLPHWQGPLPTVAQLCHNQSGLRDYWALTVLEGAAPEGRFSAADGLALIGQARSGQFAPGSRYSYSNGNFRLLAELIVRATGRDFGALLAERVLAPAGMATAVLAPDTARPLDGVRGYEGNDAVGFLPAESAIHWFGDAGIAAALDDMLAWEAHVDATRDDALGLYNRLCAPVTFADGAPAPYGFGLRRGSLAGRAFTGHGGALRGFSCHRLHLATERLSVVVMFNHESSALQAARGLVLAALGEAAPPTVPAAAAWDGLWFDARDGLVLRTTATGQGVRMDYGPSPALLTPEGPDRAAGNGITLQRDGDGLILDCPGENLHARLDRLAPIELADAAEIAGRYRSDEIGAGLEIGAGFVQFDGMLGEGPAERLHPLARDLWAVACRRSMDAPAPGDWTLQVCRDGAGRVVGLTLGCWLARRIDYVRV